MRLKEFTKIDERPIAGSFPFKTSHFIKDMTSRLRGVDAEKAVARKFKQLQAKWGKNFNPDKALHHIAQITNLDDRHIRAWLQHANLMESDEV